MGWSNTDADRDTQRETQNIKKITQRITHETAYGRDERKEGRAVVPGTVKEGESVVRIAAAVSALGRTKTERAKFTRMKYMHKVKMSGCGRGGRRGKNGCKSP